jgi:hypothetical protein
MGHQSGALIVTHITPYLAMVLGGFAAFVIALAFGQLRTATISRKRK